MHKINFKTFSLITLQKFRSPPYKKFKKYLIKMEKFLSHNVAIYRTRSVAHDA